MANGDVMALNGRRRDFTMGSIGAGFAILVGLVTFLLTLGGERQRVLSHVETMEPMREQAVQHFTPNSGLHLTELQRSTLASVPVELGEIKRRLAAIEEAQIAILREVRK